MVLFVLFALLGDCFLQFLPKLPVLWLIGAALIASCAFWSAARSHYSYTYLPLAFMLGLAWSAWYAHDTLQWQLPIVQESKPITIIGHVASLPIQDKWQKSFFFNLDHTHTLVRLSWRNPLQPIHAGDHWQLQVRLKRIHGTQNPGSFDYEAWSLQKGLRATGYVVMGGENTLLGHDVFSHPVEQWREKLQARLSAVLPHSSTSPWLMALTIGERHGVNSADWEILRNTGTNHLMAIAGLHIGMMSGLVHLLVSWLWRRIPKFTLYIPAQLAGASAALIMAVAYSALSGFAIPTQRACIMLSVFIIALLSRRLLPAWHAWSLAMLVVLLINPLSVLTESFWLSFGTIALIIYGMSGRLSPAGLWWKWGRAQWVIGVGLMPLTLALFQECSLVSVAANSVAIPWLGFLILPFCLLSSVFLFISPAIGSALLWLADKSLSGLWVVLSWFSSLPVAAWHQAMPNHFILLLTIGGVLLLLLPSGFSGRWLGALWMMPLLLFQSPKPQEGEVWMTLLDVGQGLSAVIQTKHHLLVYDAGLKFGDSIDMGESVVVPYLRTMGAKKIDDLVISHGDADHIGGAKAVLKSFPVKRIQTSVPEKLPTSTYCLAGEKWEWDGVMFSFLYPDRSDLDRGNDSSCVLRIESAGKKSVLLTGDIEKYAERQLLQNNLDDLSATILIAPHHGSKTSALPAFVKAVHPNFILYATGYRNRYHFPHQRVVESYQEIGSHQLNSAETGAMMFQLNGEREAYQLYRPSHARYWF